MRNHETRGTMTLKITYNALNTKALSFKNMPKIVDLISLTCSKLTIFACLFVFIFTDSHDFVQLLTKMCVKQVKLQFFYQILKHEINNTHTAHPPHKWKKKNKQTNKQTNKKHTHKTKQTNQRKKKRRQVTHNLIKANKTNKPKQCRCTFRSQNQFLSTFFYTSSNLIRTLGFDTNISLHEFNTKKTKQKTKDETKNKTKHKTKIICDSQHV